MEKNSKLNSAIDIFSKDLKILFGNDLLSIILTGSAAGGGFNPKFSDINFLVILTENGIGKIGGVRKYLKKWNAKRISLPLFLTVNYVNASLDTFPIEFFNMKSSYKLIWGDDVLEKIEFEKDKMRLQCERELKGKLLQLRQGYISTKGAKRALERLIRESIVSFMSIFRVLLFLKGEDVPVSRDEILEKACDSFDLDTEIFIALSQIKDGVLKLTKKELDLLVVDYIAEIAQISEIVDKM